MLGNKRIKNTKKNIFDFPGGYSWRSVCKCDGACRTWAFAFNAIPGGEQ